MRVILSQWESLQIEQENREVAIADKMDHRLKIMLTSGKHVYTQSKKETPTQLFREHEALSKPEVTIMQPGSKDKPYPILITGRELDELKKLTWLMAEAYDLDRRIEAYQGKRPIGLYRWDMDCLLDVIDDALTGRWNYLIGHDLDYQALKALRDRLQQLSDQAYADLKRK